MKNILLLWLCVISLTNSYAQYITTRANRPLAEIDSLLVKYGIEEKLIQPTTVHHIIDSEDSPFQQKDAVQKHSVNVTLSQFFTIKHDTLTVKVASFRAPGAHSISLQLDQYQLASNASLYYYTKDHLAVAGPITNQTNNNLSKLRTLSLNADELIVVFVECGNQTKNSSSSIRVAQVWSENKDYEQFLRKTNKEVFNSSPEIACYFSQWRYESDAVGRFSAGGYQCSCTLLNNTNNDRTPYIMTSRHCLTDSDFDPFTISQAEIDKLNQATILFLYRYKDCNGYYAESIVAFPGATYLDSWSVTDHLLIRLKTTYMPPYLNFVGWDRTSYGITASFPVTGISHPSGNRQKYTYGTASRPGTDAYKYKVAWSVGDTEQGSSGSAIFDTYHKFVGQLAYALTYDNYGRFSEE